MFSCACSSTTKSSWHSWFNIGNLGSTNQPEQNQTLDPQSKMVAEAFSAVRLAEWAFDPTPIKTIISAAIRHAAFAPDILHIVAEYLHVPLDPNSIFTPDDWNTHYGNRVAVPRKMLKGAIETSLQWHVAFPADIIEMVTDYLDDRDWAKKTSQEMLKILQKFPIEELEGTRTESIFWNANEDGLRSIKHIKPTVEIEVALQSPDPFNPGKKVKETCFLIYIPNKTCGRDLTIEEMENSVKEFPTQEAHCPMGASRCSKCDSNVVFFYKKSSVNQHAVLYPDFKKTHSNLSCWLLIQKNNIPGTEMKDINYLSEIIKKGEKEHWRFPYLREIVIASFAYNAKTKKLLFFDPKNLSTFKNYNTTVCQAYMPSIGKCQWLNAGGLDQFGFFITLVDGKTPSGGLAPVKYFLAE